MDDIRDYLKSAGYILLELVVYTILTAIIAGAFAAIAHFVFRPGQEFMSEDGLGDPYVGALTEFLPLLLGAVGALILHQNIFKRSWQETGIVKTHWLKEFGQGYLLAFILLIIGFLILLAFGFLKIDGTNFNPYLFFGFIVLFIVQSSFEEVVCRSFMISAFDRRSNMWVALILSSLLFALLHIGNPNMSIIAMLNLLLAGALMGLLFIWSKRIWLPIGLHAGWNFLQGSFFGYEVSGIEVYSYIQQTTTGPEVLSGADFGYEGSILATITLAACCYWILLRHPEMMTEPLIIETDTESDDIAHSSII